MTDPLLAVDHLKTIASRLVEALNRQSASGLINRQILVLTGQLQQALGGVGSQGGLMAVPSIEWLRIVNGGQMSEEHRAMVKAMHEGRHWEPTA